MENGIFRAGIQITPYLWGIAGTSKGKENQIPEHLVDGLALGVQRNFCISDFCKENGATVFKLGSHVLAEGPLKEWGNGNAYMQRGHRAEHGIPYRGPEADVLEAPGGSIIVYDTRT